LGVAGNPILKTRNLDSLAMNGILFKNAYTTTSICAVSRASILSGQYARRHNILDFNRRFTDKNFDQTFPMLLKKSGYKIGFIGKFGVGNSAPSEKFDFWRGFDGQGNYMVHDDKGKSIHSLNLAQEQIGEFINQYEESTSPFFLQVSFKAPHAEDEKGEGEEFIYDKAYEKYYNNVNWNMPEAAKTQYFNYFPEKFTKDNESRRRWAKRFAAPQLITKTMQGYYRLIHHIDDVVGNMLQQLREKNLDKNTIIIFSSDNGYYLGEYGLADKWFGSEPSIRVPLIIYDPRKNAPRGVKSDNKVLNIDIAPTILQYAKLPMPDIMQGKSLAQQVNNNPRQTFLYEHLWTYNHIYIPSTEGVVDNQYKYMRYFKGTDSTRLIFEELYDLKNDPNELNNLVEKPNWAFLKDSLIHNLKIIKESAK
jgi:arylsulfatase A-like enzyme